MSHVIIAATVVAALAFVVGQIAAAEELCPGRTTVSLWPAGAPGMKAVEPEKIMPPTGDGITRVTNVSEPTITLFPAKGGVKPGPAVVVCPGGGYNILAFTHEGIEVAEWLNSIGVTAIILKYRVPGNREGAFQDVQRAFGLVRQKAGEWDIDPKRVGILGFSAGAHLSARASTDFEKRSYSRVDVADNLSCRPDFAMLIYPAYLANAELNGLADEFKVTQATPRTILIQTQDDSIKVENSILYYMALKRAKVPSELHVFPTGGHGYGLRPSAHAISKWPEFCQTWMKKTGLLDGVTGGKP
ncbi:MAG TPA: alpha/beta hydrolase [Candidatus Brocadiia bacterium]|nr:alpha/beta hydrolase [Candidatus Brocadiia bacterium]